MLKQKNPFFLPLSIFFIASSGFIHSAVHAGAGIGADIYCVMREGGNSHDASWRAAYQSIKIQKQGLFKTSPKQAASMIVEAVVRNPDKFNDCITYLGDLYPDGETVSTKAYGTKRKGNTEINNTKDRYSY